MLGLGNSLAISQPPSAADTTSFISTWTVAGDEAARTVTLPLVSNGTINFTIDWGDDSSGTVTAYNDADRVHIYSTNGTYTVTMAGTIRGLQFADGGDKTKIRTITQWGTFNLTNNATFRGCSNLNVTATDAPTVSSTSLSLAFTDCAALTSIGGDWDVSAVDNMPYVFQNCTLFNQDISSWDTSSATTMLNMFNNADAFNNGGQPLVETGNNWDVSSVTSFASMFSGCLVFNADISDWTTSSATSMTSMFNGTGAFNQDIGDWDTGEVADMSAMFVNNDSFNQDISGWDISKVTNMAYFLANNTALTTANYDALLIAWEGQTEQADVVFHAGDATYTGGGTAATARAALVTNGWTITDGGTA